MPSDTTVGTQTKEEDGADSYGDATINMLLNEVRQLRDRVGELEKRNQKYQHSRTRQKFRLFRIQQQMWTEVALLKNRLGEGRDEWLMEQRELDESSLEGEAEVDNSGSSGELFRRRAR